MKIDEIKIYYERAKDAKLPDGDTDYQKQEEFLFWLLDSGHLGILIEQAKDKKLEQENKRYREAIVIALGELTTILEIENLTQGQIRECAGNAYNKLHEALEELS